jgi:hypothetical protein
VRSRWCRCREGGGWRGGRKREVDAEGGIPCGASGAGSLRDRQAGRQTGRQTGTDRQADRHRQAGRQADKHRQADR